MPCWVALGRAGQTPAPSVGLPAETTPPTHWLTAPWLQAARRSASQQVLPCRRCLAALSPAGGRSFAVQVVPRSWAGGAGSPHPARCRGDAGGPAEGALHGRDQHRARQVCPQRLGCACPVGAGAWVPVQCCRALMLLCARSSTTFAIVKAMRDVCHLQAGPGSLQRLPAAAPSTDETGASALVQPERASHNAVRRAPRS